MAIDIKFNLTNNPEPLTILLANRNGNKLGQLDIDEKSVELNDKFVDASEFSFTLHKYKDAKDIEDDDEKELTNLWHDVVDFKLVYCKEWDKWFEIQVELDEATETIKTVTCTQLGQAELSQIMLYDIEINTEEDIARDDYKITILYDENDKKASLLDRILEKAPHYRIAHVDSTIANMQRTFSFDGTSIDDAFKEIGEEIGCLFDYPSNSSEDGKIQRDIYVYDLYQNCNDCGYRGEFTDVCPKCGSTNIKYGYGEDTLIFVTADELASGGIQFVTDVDSVKNCFKLEAGDDLMTATIRSCNPNGTDYIWYLSNSVKDDMSEELVEKLNSYNEIYKQYNNQYVSNVDTRLLDNYNSLVNKYSIYNKELQSITTPIIGYSSLMNAYYNVVDLSLYLKSGLMPSVEMSKTSAAEQAKLLTTSSLSPIGVADASITSLATANSAVLAMAKIIVKPTYKVQIGTSELYTSGNKKYWKGNFVVTNYSDEEDTITSDVVDLIEIVDNDETIIKQKIEKALNKENTDDLSISGLFEKGHDDFCNELKKYALNPLTSFHEACQVCIDILIEQGVGDSNTWGNTNEGSESNLYEKLYTPYYNKLMAIESEIKVREDEINIILGVYDIDGNLIVKGLQTNIEECKSQIQNSLDFENYLGEDLWLEFCTYRREDKYSNENYISDGLNNAELFKKALEFIEVAENEIYKSSELQHSISTTLKNLLAIEKFKPLVKYFKVGNWIRVQVDDKIYKLRLLEYNIDYGDFDNIPVEFSDVTKIKNGITDVQDTLSKASSMASSYDATKKQASQGNEARTTIEQWRLNGLNSALVQIQNNENEEVTLNKSGLLGRSYSDITGTYSPEQIKITHNILAYTDDDWRSVRLAIGKHNYVIYDESENKFVDKIGYGINADFVTAGVVTGSQIIGGDVYSDNYVPNKSGSYINLRDGTFNFGGGSLKWDGNSLSINSPDIPNELDVASIATQITKDTVTAQFIGTLNLTVGNEISMGEDAVISWNNISNQPTIPTSVSQLANDSGYQNASQVTTITKDTVTTSYVNALGIKAASVDAENISGTTITGKTIDGGSIKGGSININNKFIVDSEGNAEVDGKINARSGTISGFAFNENTMTTTVTKTFDYTDDDRTIVRNIIMNKITPTTEQLQRYDINGDGNIYSTDYVMIGNIINIDNKITTTFRLKPDFSLANNNIPILEVSNDAFGKTSIDQLGNLYSKKAEFDSIYLNNSNIESLFSPVGVKVENDSAIILYDGGEASPSFYVDNISQYKYFLVQLQSTDGTAYPTWIHVPYCNSYLSGHFRGIGGYETNSNADGGQMYFLRGTIVDSTIEIASCWSRYTSTMTSNASSIQMHIKRVIGVK